MIVLLGCMSVTVTLGPHFTTILMTSQMQAPLVGWGNNLEESSQLVSGRVRAALGRPRPPSAALGRPLP